MSLKSLKDWLGLGRSGEFKEIHSVLNQLEDLYNKKLTVLAKLQTGKITTAVFQIKFYSLLDANKFLDVLEDIFSNTIFINEIKKLRENIELQQTLAFAKTFDADTLAKTLQAEQEILAVEEKIVRQEEAKQSVKQQKVEQEEDVTFEQIQFEQTASEKYLTFDKSLQELRARGYQRHPRPQEAFALIIAYLEGRLSPQQTKIVVNMLRRGEWLSCAFERQGNMLIAYLDPEGLVLDGEEYVKKKFKHTGSMQFTINQLPSQQAIELVDIPDELVYYIYGRKFRHLPEKIQKNAVFWLPDDGTIWPVGRGVYVNYYNVFACNYYVRASRGVVVGKKVGKQ